MLKVGIEKEDISNTWEHNKQIADEIVVKVCYMENDDSQSLLVVMDFQGLWFSYCNQLREMLSNELDIPVSAIGIFTTQNHSTPYDNGKCFDYEAINKATLLATKKAKEKSTEAEIAFLDSTPEKPLVFKRRKYFENMGGFTYWFGYDQAPNGPLIKSLIEKSFCSLLDGKISQIRCQTSYEQIENISNEDDYQIFEADDPKIQGIFFRDTDQQTIGSLLRFGAHPATANKKENDFTTADYPYYFRTAIEKSFGGESLFFTGPCGDQCPNIPEKSLNLSKDLGETAAKELIKKFDQLTWESCYHFAASSPSIELSQKNECSIPLEDIKTKIASKKEAFEKLVQADLPSDQKLNDLKNLSDEIEVLNVVSINRSSHDIGISNQVIDKSTHTFDLTKVEINDIVICGIPGEPFGEYANKIQDNVDGKNAFVIDEANGYLGYLPTEKEFGTGGYECNVALFDKNSEKIITDAFL